jgi:hypothetical protein
MIRRRLDALDWESVSSDAQPFLDSSASTDLLTRQNVMRLLSE